MEVQLKPFQDNFVYSPSRFPAYVGGWATGKSMCGIIRAMLYSQHIPDNLGVIFRKEFTDLQDSTIKDFTSYTSLVPDSHRQVILSNKSIIMFRHIEELNNIQNVNLGWYLIEQAEELDTDKEFFLLFGRLRRKAIPDAYFKSLNIPERSGFIIANAGDNWIKRLWKDGLLAKQAPDLSNPNSFCSLVEATTWDNADILTQDYLDSLKVLEKAKPEIYKQFVLNDWTVTQDNFILIKPKDIEALRKIQHNFKDKRRAMGCDPSVGGDACVAYVVENGTILEKTRTHQPNAMATVGDWSVLARKWGLKGYAVDGIGIGQGMISRGRELGFDVRDIQSAAKSTDSNCTNLRTQMWVHVSQLVIEGKIPYPEDEELIRQLTSVRYKVYNSAGLIGLEPKEDTKKRLGCSPDDADAFVYAVWQLKFAPIVGKDTKPDASVSTSVTSAWVA